MVSTYTAGGEFIVNTTQQYNQGPGYHGHNITGLPGGGYVIVWQGGSADGTFDIYMQRYNNDGTMAGAQTMVNTTVPFGQTLPQVTFLKDGGYLVAWTNYTGVDDSGNATGGDIFFQRYTASGAKVGGETMANTTTANEQDTPSVIGLDDGGYVITWDSYAQDGDRYGEYGQRYDSNGAKVGGEIHISTSTIGSQDSSSIAALPAFAALGFGGGLVVVYNNATAFDTAGNATNYDVLMQRFDINGVAVGTETLVNTTTAGNQDFTSVTALAGGFVVTWVDDGTAGDHAAVVRQQLYLDTGQAAGVETVVNSTSHTGDVLGTSATVLLDGTYVITWTMSDATGANYDVYLQHFDGTGNKIGGEVVVSADAGNQIYSSVAVLNDGSYVVTYRSPDSDLNGMYQKVFYLDQVINGTSGDDTLTGNANFATTINGGAGNDTLSGGSGLSPDTLNGGDGNDILYVDGGDTAIGGAGDDTLMIRHLNGLNLSFEGDAGHDIIDTTLTDFDPTLFMAGGVEEFRGGARNDTVDGHLTTDTAILFNGGAGNDILTGGTLNDTLNGGDGNDTLNGWSGKDTMSGGLGNDTYAVDNTGDIVIEDAGAGTDTVNSAINYTLTDNVENLNLMGTANLNGTGNALANTLVGTSGNNILDGGAGADTLIGGLGDDTYIVDVKTDVIVENAGEGTDTVRAAFSYTLGANLENLVLTGAGNIGGTGNAMDNSLTGNAGNNLLTGGDGKDILDGGLGADTLRGGLGNDTYYVDNAGDVVTEAVGEGTDTVFSTVNWTLGDNVERLTLMGKANLTGTGNALANVIIGNDGSNHLNGGAGNDTLSGGLGDDALNGGKGADNLKGGAGNDTYYVDNTGDVVTEFSGQGEDTVITNLNYALGANVEDLILVSTHDYYASGNALDNHLTGNVGKNLLHGGDGNDVIDGGKGADKMYGGLGNDTFYVDNIGDVVVEYTGQGTDTVISSLTYTLSGAIENLTLSGTGNVNGTGNALSNVLVGNAGKNTLDGGTGHDTLTGGAGADVFLFGANSGADTITDFSAAQGDKINVNAYTHGTAHAAFITHVGADTIITLSTGNVITVTGASVADVSSHMIW